MRNLVAWTFVAFALGGCASEPTWNTAVFPEQPQYGMPGQASTVAAAPKK